MISLHSYLVYTYEQLIFIDEIQVYSRRHIQLSSTRAHSGDQPNIFCFLFQKKKKNKNGHQQSPRLFWRVLLVLVLWKFAKLTVLCWNLYSFLFLFKTPAFHNNASVLKRTFACPRLKHDFPSFLFSLYVRTTNIYWRNSSLFSTTHPTSLHSCPFWCLYNTLAEKVYFPLLFLFKTPA
jgi:hypothetical protein